MFSIISLSLCLITLICLWFKEHYLSAIYLSFLFVSDVVRLGLQSIYLGLPVPYTGYALFLFGLHNIIYLAVPALLAYLISCKCLKGKCGALPCLCFGSASLLCILGYPNLIRGVALLNLFSSFYLLMFLIGVVIFVLNIKHKINIDQMILGLASMGGLTWTIFSIVFGFDLAIFGNIIYYFLTLLILFVHPLRLILDQWRENQGQH